MNSLSYAWHYRNLDSVRVYADSALALSGSYSAGKAEAYNNLAFAALARMEYGKAYELLSDAVQVTDNQVELLVSDVLFMRLCQRESKNKDFYEYKERAANRLKRINEELRSLTDRMRMRLIYAQTELAIVCSTYYYYVGLTRQSKSSLEEIDPSGDIQKDTAQYLNYLYQIGSGGIINENTRFATAQKELDYLFKCYVMAREGNYVYWQANALQSISEHLLSEQDRDRLLDDNRAAFVFVNEDNMHDSLLAGYLAQKAWKMFSDYGDVYQIVGAYRTLSFCYWALGDYTSSLICLENALNSNPAVRQAPDLVASIRECLSMVYSAVDDKNNSDINRNEYLDIQEETRQDRQLEARAEQLSRTSTQLNVLITVILVLMAAVIVLFYVFNRLGKKKNSASDIDRLLVPLKKWEDANKLKVDELNEKYETVTEQLSLSRLTLEKEKRRSLDNKAKAFLVNNVIPYIDRIINDARKLKNSSQGTAVYDERKAYMAELTDKINEYNDVLTNWIQLQQGQLSLHIESFNISELFDILSKSAMSFKLKGVNFEVQPVDAVVKADKVLTVFMLNTLADNARKFTPEGGTVSISAVKEKDYVEVSVRDTGIGLSSDELSGIFDHKVHNGHGFGLMNCKGIIDKYKKISQIFSVCGLFAESVKGKGSRFYFRLPYGFIRTIVVLMLILSQGMNVLADSKGEDVSNELADNRAYLLEKADIYADSAYYSNVNGTYAKTLEFADSVISCLNRIYELSHPKGTSFIFAKDNGDRIPAELRWVQEGVKINYDIILDIRNESAVAALALHQWDLYIYNNRIYTRLFKELSADKGLADYCVAMQVSKANKTVAIIILVILFVAIFPAYYFLYYRHILYFRFCVENVKSINRVLLSDINDKDKLSFIESVDAQKYPEVLKDVIQKIKAALEQSVNVGDIKSLNIELAADELRRVKYETEKLYVSNCVIDNSLSTLKHETMYYPSRIRQLVNNNSVDISVVSEVAMYYKELYSVLCEQIRRQTDAIKFECKPFELEIVPGKECRILGDKTLAEYLFDILKKQYKYVSSDITVNQDEGRYMSVSILCHDDKSAEGHETDLFAPDTANIPFLICRQIVRENVEQTNLHGCGISLCRDVHGNTVLKTTLASAADHTDIENEN